MNPPLSVEYLSEFRRQQKHTHRFVSNCSLGHRTLKCTQTLHRLCHSRYVQRRKVFSDVAITTGGSYSIFGSNLGAHLFLPDRLLLYLNDRVSFVTDAIGCGRVHFR